MNFRPPDIRLGHNSLPPSVFTTFLLAPSSPHHLFIHPSILSAVPLCPLNTPHHLCAALCFSVLPCLPGVVQFCPSSDMTPNSILNACLQSSINTSISTCLSLFHLLQLLDQAYYLYYCIYMFKGVSLGQEPVPVAVTETRGSVCRFELCSTRQRRNNWTTVTRVSPL